MSLQTDEGTLARRSLPKVATGIQGLDEITGGGLPRGRPTLVCGGAERTDVLRQFLTRFLERHTGDYDLEGLFVS
jgi:circadian clock protein KaiC